MGAFEYDKANGQGTMNYSNGDKYFGEWLNKKKSGKGVMVYNNGSLYDGEWKNDLKEGNGILTDKNGEVQHNGIWKENEPMIK